MAAPFAAALMSSGGMQGMGQVLSSGINATAQGITNRKNRKFAEKQAKQAQKWTQENMALAHDYAVADAKSADSYKIQSLKAAGLNPMLAYEGANAMPLISPSAGAVGNAVDSKSPFATLAQGSDIAGLIGEIREQARRDDLNEATVENLNADTALKGSQTAGQNIDNIFNDETLWDKIHMTGKEYKVKQEIFDYQLQHPELTEAIAKSQAVINDKLSSEADLNRVTEALRNVEYDTEKAKQALLKAQTMLTNAQRVFLEHSDYRDNHDNIGWLINEVKRVQRSNMSDQDKADILAVLGASIEQNSVPNHMSQQTKYQLLLQGNALMADNELEIANQQDRRHGEFTAKDFFQDVAIAYGVIHSVGHDLPRAPNKIGFK